MHEMNGNEMQMPGKVKYRAPSQVTLAQSQPARTGLPMDQAHEIVEVKLEVRFSRAVKLSV